MKKWLKDPAQERSASQITAVFRDQAGNTFVPKTLTWTLYDGLAAVVNSREDVAITPASTVSVMLSGDDLVLNDQTRPKEVRTLCFEGTYDSGALVDIPFREELFFFLENGKGV